MTMLEYFQDPMMGEIGGLAAIVLGLCTMSGATVKDASMDEPSFEPRWPPTTRAQTLAPTRGEAISACVDAWNTRGRLPLPNQNS